WTWMLHILILMAARLSSAPSARAAHPRPGLAAGAEVGGAVHELLAHDRGPAPGARPPGLAVGGERAVEVAARAVDVDVELVEARPALVQGLAHDVGGVVEHAPDRGRGQRRRH